LKIQNLRKLKGISQEELADKVGVSRQMASKWKSVQSISDINKVVIIFCYKKVNNIGREMLRFFTRIVL